MTSRKSVYFKNLDGLRAIAAFAVVMAHTSYWITYPNNVFYSGLKQIMSFGGAGGRLGVIFFFILSGFLITYLMFIEQQRKGKLNIIHFYIRRILRIWPLYFATLIVGFFIYPYLFSLGGKEFYERASFLWYLLFAANFDHIYHGYPSSNILGVQWSVAVEEQFYLIWPIIFTFFHKRNFFLIALLGFIGLSELFSIIKVPDYTGGDYHLFACIRYLAYGALIAYYSYYRKDLVDNFFSKISKIGALIIYSICLFIMFFQYTIIEFYANYEFMYHIVPVIFFCFVILEQNFSKNSFFKISNIPFLSWLGKISYGIYLTHMIALNIIISLFERDGDYAILKAIGAILLTIVISALSYNTLEKYFLSLKKKFSYFSQYKL